jgi:type I restriction enzyme S subunit
VSDDGRPQVDWIDTLPKHWRVLPLRALAREGRASFIDGDWIESPFITDEGVRLLQTGNVGTGHYKEQGFRYISEETFDALNCTEVNPGDILICRLAEPVGRACIAPDLGVRMITSVDVCIMKPSDDHDRRFLVYLLSSPEYLGFMEGQCRGGTRDRVSRSFLGSVRIPVPPLPEQAAIAAFLDRETAKIDALVEEQKRLIELLKEKRQAVISHAVTKGLNPDAPMKDTGIDWLGKVPEHWSLSPLKRVAPKVTVGIVVNPSAYITEEGLPFIYGGDIEEGKIHIQRARRISAIDSQAQLKTQLEPGDLLTVRVGAPGITAVVPEECRGGNCASVMLIRRGSFNSEWLCYVMNSRSVRYQVEVVQYGAAQEQFNISHAVEFIIPVPPRREQDEIAQFLVKQDEAVDAMIGDSKQSICLLTERRAALISAAVTGKIDLRELSKEREVAA